MSQVKDLVNKPAGMMAAALSALAGFILLLNGSVNFDEGSILPTALILAIFIAAMQIQRGGSDSDTPPPLPPAAAQAHMMPQQQYGSWTPEQVHYFKLQYDRLTHQLQDALLKLNATKEQLARDQRDLQESEDNKRKCEREHDRLAWEIASLKEQVKLYKQLFDKLEVKAHAS